MRVYKYSTRSSLNFLSKACGRMAVDTGDRSSEIGQVSRSHAVLTLVHLDAQSEPDPVSDVEPL